MRKDCWYDSHGIGRIHSCRWLPEGEPKAIVQIVHGIAEHVERYDDYANFLTGHGFMVVAEDHMGHGGSVNGGGIQGYFHGGWFAAVEDTYQLLKDMKQEYPDIPYILFGHSMGSFMARTILGKYPQSGISGAVISGTCWQSAFAMPAIVKVMDAVCKKIGETNSSDKLQQMIFGGYNARVEHPRTPQDWVSRDKHIVDAHPMNNGFLPKSGLLRDMMVGIAYIERKGVLSAMEKNLPVLFVAGGDDPVGGYGKGVRQAADAFRKVGMKNVSLRIYPMCRHEILNEINREEIYGNILQWMNEVLK